MKRIYALLLTIAALLTIGILSVRSPAKSVFMPDCSEVKNEHYSGPCVALMIDGVITGDTTTDTK